MSKIPNSATLTQKSSRFLRSYVVFLWIMLIACIAGWLFLNKALNTYENSLPINYAKAIMRQMQTGDMSCLNILSESDYEALELHITENGLSYVEAKEISREKGNYTYRITSQGAAIYEFTLAPDGDQWEIVSASISDLVKNRHKEAFSLKLAESIKELIISYSYEELYPLLASTGYTEDTIETFTAFMRQNTPYKNTVSLVRNDENDRLGYDILFKNSLFGHVGVSVNSDKSWYFNAFSMNSALVDSYTAYLADEKANGILSMVKSLDSESLYPILVLNGYPDGYPERFALLLNSIDSIENATCSRIENSDPAVRNYLISTHDERIVSFSLSSVQSNKSKSWEISSFEMPVWVPFEGTITAPACFTVTVDGKTLSAADEVARTVSKNLDKYITANVPDMVTEVTYSVSSPFTPLEISAVSEDGRQGTLTKTSDGNYQFSLPRCDEQYADELHDFLVDFAETFGLFTLNDAPYNIMLNFVDRNSSAYDFVYKGDYYWTKDHYEDKTSFANFRAENFVSLSDQIIACDVKYEMTVVYHSGDTAETYYPAYRVYLRNTTGKWMIFSFNTLSDE